MENRTYLLANGLLMVESTLFNWSRCQKVPGRAAYVYRIWITMPNGKDYNFFYDNDEKTLTINQVTLHACSFEHADEIVYGVVKANNLFDRLKGTVFEKPLTKTLSEIKKEIGI